MMTQFRALCNLLKENVWENHKTFCQPVRLGRGLTKSDPSLTFSQNRTMLLYGFTL